MICNLLTSIGIPTAALLHGSLMHDMEHMNTGKTIGQLDQMQAGKDDSIRDMLANGNGFTNSSYTTYVARAAYDDGNVQERRDLRSFNLWSRDLNQCLADRRHGRVA